MKKLQEIQEKLDSFFRVKDLESDPAMKIFVPLFYEKRNEDWKKFYEKDFQNRFNGLAISGNDPDSQVKNVFLCSFPSEKIVQEFLEKSEKNDLLFSHHAVNMNWGDPKSEKLISEENFIQGISIENLKKFKEKNLNFYSLHAPLDTNSQISTNRAIWKALDPDPENYDVFGEFSWYGLGYAGIICDIPEIDFPKLEQKLCQIFEIDYIEFAGKKKEKYSRIAITAGGGGINPVDFQEALEYDIDLYLTGEIFSRIDNERGKSKQEKIKNEILPNCQISTIAVSHAGSEFLVMKTQMKNFFKENFNFKNQNIKLLRENSWWR